MKQEQEVVVITCLIGQKAIYYMGNLYVLCKALSGIMLNRKYTDYNMSGTFVMQY